MIVIWILILAVTAAYVIGWLLNIFGYWERGNGNG